MRLAFPASFDDAGLAPFYGYARQELGRYMEDGKIKRLGRIAYVLDYVYVTYLVWLCRGDVLGVFDDTFVPEDDVSETSHFSPGGEEVEDLPFESPHHERLMLWNRAHFPRSVDTDVFDDFVDDICRRFHAVRTSMSARQFVDYTLRQGVLSRGFSGCEIDMGSWAMLHGRKALGSVLYVLNDENQWRTFSKCDCICVALLTCIAEQEVLGVVHPPLCGVELDAREDSGVRGFVNAVQSRTGHEVRGHHLDTSTDKKTIATGLTTLGRNPFCSVVWETGGAGNRDATSVAYMYVHAFLILRLWYKVAHDTRFFWPCGIAHRSPAFDQTVLHIYARVRRIALDVCAHLREPPSL
jgi:hypothetical protein